MGSLRGCWGLGVIFEVTEAKFWISSIFNEFWFRIFSVLSFEVVWPQRPRRPRKEPSECFQKLHFWNQWVPLIKMHYRVRYSLDFDLKIRSGQGWGTLNIIKLIEMNSRFALFSIKAQEQKWFIFFCQIVQIFSHFCSCAFMLKSANLKFIPINFIMVQVPPVLIWCPWSLWFT